MKTKDDLREVYLKQRKQLSASERNKRNENITEQVLQYISSIFSKQDFFYLHSYKSKTKWLEVDTSRAIENIKDLFPHCQICYPVTKKNYQLESMDEAGNMIPPSQIRILLVPTLIMDKYGFRLGYGKGYYDRYLKRCSDSVHSIGLCWFAPLENKLPVNQYDMPVRSVIYPKFS